MFSLACLFVSLVVSLFGFNGSALVLIASVHVHCLPFTFSIETGNCNVHSVIDKK